MCCPREDSTVEAGTIFWLELREVRAEYVMCPYSARVLAHFDLRTIAIPLWLYRRLVGSLVRACVVGAAVLGVPYGASSAYGIADRS